MERSKNKKQQRYKDTKHRDVFGSAEVCKYTVKKRELSAVYGGLRADKHRLNHLAIRYKLYLKSS